MKPTPWYYIFATISSTYIETINLLSPLVLLLYCIRENHSINEKKKISHWKKVGLAIQLLEIDNVDDQWMKSSHVATSNKESNMAASKEKTYMESSY